MRRNSGKSNCRRSKVIHLVNMTDDSIKIEWVVLDPLNRPVTLTSERKGHIVVGHPEFMTCSYLDALPNVIKTPDMILYDKFDSDTEIFCSLGYGVGVFSGNWLKVPVRYDISDSGTVVTAHFTRVVPDGVIKWLPPKIK